jgi:hypothetical protein
MAGRLSAAQPLRRPSKIEPRARASAKPAQTEPAAEAGSVHRTAYVPLKHDSERITERWARTGRKAGAESSATVNRQSIGKLVGGVTPSATKQRLYKVAKRLAIKQRSTMTRRQLADAIERAAGMRSVRRRVR